MTQSPCRITFLNQWSAENHLWGVGGTGQEFALRRDLFACCHGDGVLVHSVNTRDANLCGLSRRWHLLSALHQQFLGQSESVPGWTKVLGCDGDSHSMKAIKGIESVMAPRLDLLLHSATGRSIILHSANKLPETQSAHLPWIVAGILAWHFEVVALVGDLQSPVLPLNHWLAMMTKHLRRPKVIILNGVTELWQSSRLENLESAISFAYQHKFPLWFYEAPSNSQPQPNDQAAEGARSQTFAAKISKHIRRTKQKPVIEWLSPQSQSRLLEVYTPPQRVDKVEQMPDVF